MKVLISGLSAFGFLMVGYSNSLSKYMSQTILFLDNLTISLLWLSVGVILAILSGNFSWSSKVLWWWMSFSILLSFSSSNLFYFYIFFEMSLIPILLMILSFGSQPERLSAGSYLLFYTTVISVPYLVLIILMDLTEISISVQGLTWSMTSVLIFLMIPFFIKMPLFSIHFWLPKAHVEASTSGSMVLAGMLLKLGSYGVARVSGIFCLTKMFSWTTSLWIMLSFISSLVTFMQSDLKKMVAYSSVTHMTFLMVGLVSMTKLTLISVVMVSLSHGWAAMGMFLMAGILGNSSSSRLGTLVGPESVLFWAMLLLGMILISNAGIPPLPSFFPEVFMLVGCLGVNSYSVMVFILLSFVVCYYNAFLFLWISHKKSSSLVSSKVFLLESMSLLMFVLISLESLMWLQMF